jgi:uncharacterized protein
MEWKLLDDDDRSRKFVLVFSTGDEIVSELLHFSNEQKVSSGHFTAIGACLRVTLGFFDLEKKEYEKQPVEEQVEVMSLIGNIAVHDKEPKIHAHIVIGKRDFTAHGGHLLDAIVRPTLELFLSEVPVILKRSIDDVTNLPLIDLNEGRN